MRHRLPTGHLFSDERFLCLVFCALPWFQLLSEEICHESAYDIRGPLLHISGDVGVGIQRKGRLGMAQDAGQCPWRPRPEARAWVAKV